MRNIYKDIKVAFDSPQKAIVATVTEVEGSNLENVFGEKIIIKENNEIQFSSEDLKKIFSKKELIDDLVDYLYLEESQAKKVELPEGEIELFFEPLLEKSRLIIFGAGHIAKPLAKIAKMINFEITIVDDRDEFINADRFPAADYLECKSFADFTDELEVRKNDYLVIVTRGHQFDYQVLRDVIKSQAAYIGMIGSSRKINQVYTELRETDKLSEELLETVHAPIGLEIGAETPEEIAVAIAGQLISVRRGSNA